MFISSSIFLVGSLGSLMCGIASSADRGTLAFLCSISLPVIGFSCLTAIVKQSLDHLMPKRDKVVRKEKIHTSFPDEHRDKNSEQNTCQENSRPH